MTVANLPWRRSEVLVDALANRDMNQCEGGQITGLVWDTLKLRQSIQGEMTCRQTESRPEAEERLPVQRRTREGQERTGHTGKAQHGQARGARVGSEGCTERRQEG